MNRMDQTMSPEAWVDRYGDDLYRFALSRIKDPSVAEDLVQETFLAAIKARERFKGRSSVRTWLIAILKHKLVDYFRRQHREKYVDDMDSFTDSDTIDSFFSPQGDWKIRPQKWDSNPMKIYEQSEFMDVLYRCLADLPGRLAEAFILREMEDLSTEEICKVLDISATNSWVMLHRARMNLRHCLETNWFVKTV